MPTSSIHSFDRLILRFLKERQFHLEAVEEIDAIFKKHGISTMAHREGNGLLGTTTMRVAHRHETVAAETPAEADLVLIEEAA